MSELWRKSDVELAAMLTRNPWNPQRSPGSSGGEAAALATGMSPLGLGRDLGGSLRSRAHCCGVASIKPTTGAVPAPRPSQ